MASLLPLLQEIQVHERAAEGERKRSTRKRRRKAARAAKAPDRAQRVPLRAAAESLVGLARALKVLVAQVARVVPPLFQLFACWEQCWPARQPKPMLTHSGRICRVCLAFAPRTTMSHWPQCPLTTLQNVLPIRFPEKNDLFPIEDRNKPRFYSQTYPTDSHWKAAPGCIKEAQTCARMWQAVVKNEVEGHRPSCKFKCDTELDVSTVSLMD